MLGPQDGGKGVDFSGLDATLAPQRKSLIRNQCQIVILGFQNRLSLLCLFSKLLGINEVSGVGKLAQMGNGWDRVVDGQ